MRKTKVSVLISTNLIKGRNRLNASLQSIVDQRPDNYEIELLLTIDGPTQPTECQWINEKLISSQVKFRIFNNNDNLGLAKSLNQMIVASDTDLFVRHDDDDLMCQERLSKTTKYFRELRSPTLLGSNYYIINEKEANPKNRKFIITHVRAPTDADLHRMIPISPPFAHPTIAFSSVDSDGDIPRYDERFTFAQDFKFYLDNLSKLRFRSANFESIIYFTPISSPEKRKSQLSFHDLALYEFYKNFFNTSLQDAHAFRCRFITSEYCNNCHPELDAAISFRNKVLEQRITFSNTTLK